jgi:hypothetical protein
MSPRLALATTVRAIAMASLSVRASAMSEARLRTPLGLPPGLPDTPRSKGRPRCFLAVLCASKSFTSAAGPGSGVERHPYFENIGWEVRLALQLLYLKASESMGNHDSKVVDADSVD